VVAMTMMMTATMMMMIVCYNV